MWPSPWQQWHWMPEVHPIDAMDDELFAGTYAEFLPESVDRVGTAATPEAAGRLLASGGGIQKVADLFSPVDVIVCGV
jgi:hypothetical protein